MSIFLFEGEVWESNKIREIFGLESHLVKMQKVEAALANAEADLGIIPKDAAKEINSMVGIQYMNVDIYNEQLRITGGHPVVPFLKAWKPAFNGWKNA
jgi:adenylosuccinate lyase